MSAFFHVDMILYSLFQKMMQGQMSRGPALSQGCSAFQVLGITSASHHVATACRCRSPLLSRGCRAKRIQSLGIMKLHPFLLRHWAKVPRFSEGPWGMSSPRTSKTVRGTRAKRRVPRTVFEVRGLDIPPGSRGKP